MNESLLSKEMQLNKLTLAFPQKFEKIFLKQYYLDSVFQFRIAFILVMLLYGIFGYLDTYLNPKFTVVFFVIRYLIVIPILGTVFLLSFSKIFQQIWQGLLFLSFIVAGTGISVMTMLVPENYAYYGGLMLIFTAGYFFIKLRFFLATLAGFSTLILFNIGAIFYAETPTLIILNNNFFYLGANVIGMFAAYNIEYYARRNFYLNYKLDQEKHALANLNKNLEEIVEKRTHELLIAKEKAEESDQLKSAFLANMSHEIRTPMNGILSFAELLKEPDLKGEDQLEYIQIIEKSGMRMLGIINDIVDVSKIESGIMETHYTLTSLVDILNDQIDFFTPEVKAKNLKIIYESTPYKDLIINTDKEKLEAILVNLIKNAIKYTQEGEIRIGFEQDTEKLSIFVSDTGIGIPKDRQLAIFDRFVQADIADKMALQGAGLGLSIAKAYAEILNGKLHLKSEVGEGTIFYLDLPLHEIQHISLVEDEGKTESQELVLQSPKLNILIAEDEYTSALVLSKTLKPLTNKLFLAKTGDEAVNNFKANPDIDLILMDIKMPGMNGYEATEAIRKFDKDVTIIAQTAHAMGGDKQRALDSGCNDYISKPIRREELFYMIDKHFGKNDLGCAKELISS
ncbi:MAG: response regulator [Bacteroidales bacterium]|jgi:signal transduction histidine kinase/ActR/RegA family two-component response regulator|nr:response regulator [Bacteroidales bacterium]